MFLWTTFILLMVGCLVRSASTEVEMTRVLCKGFCFLWLFRKILAYKCTSGFVYLWRKFGEILSSMPCKRRSLKAYWLHTPAFWLRAVLHKQQDLVSQERVLKPKQHRQLLQKLIHIQSKIKWTKPVQELELSYQTLALYSFKSKASTLSLILFFQSECVYF